MKTRKTFFTILFILVASYVNAQSGFQFTGKNLKNQRVKFKLINNLIVIPLEINGKTLSFILDTGVNKTILFNLSANDSLSLQNTRKIMLQGLGGGEPVAALLSRKNQFKIKGLESNDETIHVILKDFFDLSSKMGITINGIIGFSLFKNLIVKVNYNTKKIDFYNPRTFKYKECKKCETFPITFHSKKPFINLKVQLDTISNKTTNVKMLLDSGGSDSMWLFENSKDEIKTPNRFFDDILGEGLSGTIFGKRSRIPKIIFGDFEIIKPTVSFLDSISTKNARKLKSRNGSIGGGLLKRFKVLIDYPNKKITLKKNGSFTKGFNYNMSGIEVVYSGKQMVKEEVSKKYNTNYNQNTDSNNSISFVTEYAFNFKPSYEIQSVQENSPAGKAGLLKDDVILRINNKPTHEMSISDIVSKFQERDKKLIKLLVNRNGIRLKFQFRLEKKI